MKKPFLILALLMVAVLIAGCTSATSSPSDANESPSSTATPAPVTDLPPPEEDDNLLPLGEIVMFRDATEENELSLKVASFTDRGSYEPAGESLKFTAPQGWRYLFVHVVVTHRGHRGDGYWTDIYAPPVQQFSLMANGKTYRPESIQAKHLVNIGELYHGDEWVDRNEKCEGYIVYKVPESVVTSGGAEITADIVGLKHYTYGRRSYGQDCYNFKSCDKNPVWKL